MEYSLDDINEEEVTLEWETRPPGEPPICPHGHGPMVEQQTTHTITGGKFTVTYSVYICPQCNETFLDREQAKRYGAIQLLDRLLQKRGATPTNDVLFDGEDFFVRLSLAREMAALWRQTASKELA
jgi:YgiT-type zinc finger domain-containing protein